MQKEKYRELYQYCQGLTPKVSRSKIEPVALRLTGQDVRVVKSGLDTEHCRGLFISVSNTETRLVQQFGTNIIVIARGLNYCWERFVYTKELMHLFDSENDKTATKADLTGLLADLSGTGSPVDKSPQALSDKMAIWMALACLCPEKDRLEFEDQRAKGHIDDYAIALRLKIPKLYVPALFVPEFPQLISLLLQE